MGSLPIQAPGRFRAASGQQVPGGSRAGSEPRVPGRFWGRFRSTGSGKVPGQAPNDRFLDFRKKAYGL